MEIKRTRILHKRLTKNEWLDSTRNNLRQGEIGALINDSGETQEVRIGLRDIILEDGTIIGGSFFECMLLGMSGEDEPEAVRAFATRFNFPSLGSERCIYIDKSNNSLYRWDDKDNKYYSVSSSTDWHDIEEIHGGNAKI